MSKHTPGPQRGPASVARIEAQTKSVKKELESAAPETVWRVRWGWFTHGQRTEWVEYRQSKATTELIAEQKRQQGYDVVVEEFYLVSKEQPAWTNQAASSDLSVTISPADSD